MVPMMVSISIKLAVAAVIGLIAAIASQLESGASGLCDINSYISCTQVIYSSYSSFMGVKLSLWAIAFFSLAIALIVVYTISRVELVAKILWGLLVAAIPIIAILIYIELFIIRALCIYCTIMQISIASMAIIATKHMIRGG